MLQVVLLIQKRLIDQELSIGGMLQLFMQADSSGAGDGLDYLEFRTFTEGLGLTWLSASEARNIFDVADEGKNGSISFFEFCHFVFPELDIERVYGTANAEKAVHEHSHSGRQCSSAGLSFNEGSDADEDGSMPHKPDADQCGDDKFAASSNDKMAVSPAEPQGNQLAASMPPSESLQSTPGLSEDQGPRSRRGGDQKSTLHCELLASLKGQLLPNVEDRTGRLEQGDPSRLEDSRGLHVDPTYACVQGPTIVAMQQQLEAVLKTQQLMAETLVKVQSDLTVALANVKLKGEQ